LSSWLYYSAPASPKSRSPPRPGFCHRSTFAALPALRLTSRSGYNTFHENDNDKGLAMPLKRRAALLWGAAMRRLAGSDSSVVDWIIEPAKQAISNQASAIGPGLAQVIRACGPSRPDIAELMQREIILAGLQSPTSAFQAGLVGRRDCRRRRWERCRKRTQASSAIQARPPAFEMSGPKRHYQQRLGGSGPVMRDSRDA
jgi:hypothetical protein